MIISRAPYRISFFGGGSDYPNYYLERGGAVLSASINKYCYISLRELPPFFAHKYRIVYSNIENVDLVSDIKHPSVRACLNYMSITDGLSINHDGDLPARSGIGSSSAFTVALLNALYEYDVRRISKYSLGKEAIHVEQNIIGESVGSQDQMAVACGGLNKINFHTNGDILMDSIPINLEKVKLLQDNLVLLFTGTSRNSSDVAEKQISKIKDNLQQIDYMKTMVDEAISILTSQSSNLEISLFGKMLDETWKYKKKLANEISTDYINSIYDHAIKNGALGGKLLGAGGGGFILFCVPTELREKFIKSLKQLVHVPFRFENLGASIIKNDLTHEY
jgi:D-glycero-alpha-D-manno-heptose-7-phosphate kinase